MLGRVFSDLAHSMAGSKVAVELVLELPNLLFTSISWPPPNLWCPVIFEDIRGP